MDNSKYPDSPRLKLSRSAANRINAFLLATFFLGSLLYFGDLPQEIPMHYDLSGTPDRYASTTLLRWMTLPLVCAALLALMYAVAWLCTRMPINVLPQAEYDALPPQDKMRIVALFQRYCYWITTGITIWFMVMQFGAYRIAIGAAENRPFEPGLTIVATLLLIGSSFWIVQKTKREVRTRHKKNSNI